MRFIYCIIINLFYCIPIQAQSIKNIEDYVKAIVPIIVNKDKYPDCTGSIFHKGEKGSSKSYLVTCKHCISDYDLLNNTGRGDIKKFVVNFYTIDENNAVPLEFNSAVLIQKDLVRFHQDTLVDVAAVDISSFMNFLEENDVNLYGFNYNELKSQDTLQKYYSIADEVIVLGYPKGAYYNSYSALAKKGILASPLRKGISYSQFDNIILIDGTMTFGNSGSLAFTVPKRRYFNSEHGPLIGYDDPNLIGIQSRSAFPQNSQSPLFSVYFPAERIKETLDLFDE